MAIEAIKIKAVKAKQESVALTKELSMVSDPAAAAGAYKPMVTMESAAWGKGQGTVTERTNQSYLNTTSPVLNT